MTAKTGDMVALKGHHTFPMVVLRLVFSENTRAHNFAIQQARMNRDRASYTAGKTDSQFSIQPLDQLADREPLPEDLATVTWLDRNGYPHSETFPLTVLEALDG